MKKLQARETIRKALQNIDANWNIKGRIKPHWESWLFEDITRKLKGVVVLKSNTRGNVRSVMIDISGTKPKMRARDLTKFVRRDLRKFANNWTKEVQKRLSFMSKSDKDDTTEKETVMSGNPASETQVVRDKILLCLENNRKKAKDIVEYVAKSLPSWNLDKGSKKNAAVYWNLSNMKTLGILNRSKDGFYSVAKTDEDVYEYY